MREKVRPARVIAARIANTGKHMQPFACDPLNTMNVDDWIACIAV
jgi:hypothetical protein